MNISYVHARTSCSFLAVRSCGSQKTPRILLLLLLTTAFVLSFFHSLHHQLFCLLSSVVLYLSLVRILLLFTTLPNISYRISKIVSQSQLQSLWKGNMGRLWNAHSKRIGRNQRRRPLSKLESRNSM